MSNEITVTLSLSCYKPAVMSSAVGRSVTGALFSMSSNFFSQGVALIGLSATAIPLGQVTTPHWCWFKNLDSVNFLKIRNGSGGTDLLKLLAGEVAVVPLLDSAVPYAIADTATVDLEFMVLGL